MKVFFVYESIIITTLNAYNEHTSAIKYITQIFHAFLFHIRNYLPEVICIQRREAELNRYITEVE